MPTDPHLMEAVVTSEAHTALAILVTPEELYDSHSPRVGLGLVYKAPYIKTASFSEAFFHLKSTSDAEADKRITELCLMFVGIIEASKVIPLPYLQPLFLDVPTASDVMDSKKPRSPHAFRAYRLHRVIYAEGSTLRTQVAYPCLGGETKSHLLNFQKQQLIPELREHSVVLAALAEADDGHWNITNDPIYPTCLEAFRRRHESSQAPQANKSAEGSGTEGGSSPGVVTPPSTTIFQPLFPPTLGAHEIREIVCEILDQVYALRLETLQEMGFIREVDRALAKSIMVEFLRLQLIVGDGLNTPLQAMYADLKATAAELVRDMDIVVEKLHIPPFQEPCNRGSPPQIYRSGKTKIGPPIGSGGHGPRGYGET